MKVRKPGMRIVKTAIAVWISLIISYLRPGRGYPLYSSIAAIICLQPKVGGAINTGKNRMIGTLIGGFVGIVYLVAIYRLGLNEFLNYFLLSFVMGVMIWVLSNLNMPNAISIMAIVILSVNMGYKKEQGIPVAFAITRVIDTLIGVVVAVLVNWSDFEIRERLHKNKDKPVNEDKLENDSNK